MFYNDYEDYMRNVLGYTNTNSNTYKRYEDNCYDMNYGNMDYNMYYNNTPNYQMNSFQERNQDANLASNENIEKMYPEIYRIINPMVCRMCDNNREPVTEYMIEQMTDDIYDNVVNRVEIQNVINLNIGTRDMDVQVNVDGEDNNGNRSTNNVSTAKSNSNSQDNTQNLQNRQILQNRQEEAIKTQQEEIRETRSTRQNSRRNRLLRDLIRILILNRLLRLRRPQRPPYGRPGVPGPGGPGPRPGMPGNGMGPRPPRPRFDDYYMNNDYLQY